MGNKHSFRLIPSVTRSAVHSFSVYSVGGRVRLAGVERGRQMRIESAQTFKLNQCRLVSLSQLAACDIRSLRKHPFLHALRRWGRLARNVSSGEERGEADVFAGYLWHAFFNFPFPNICFITDRIFLYRFINEGGVFDCLWKRKDFIEHPDIYHPKQLEDRIYHINLCRKLHRNNMFTKLISYNYIRTAQFPSQKGKKKNVFIYQYSYFF